MSARADQWEVICAVAAHASVQRVYNDMVTRIPIPSAYSIATKLDKLARIARTLHRLYEVACSDPIDICEDCKSSGSGAEDHVPSRCFYARLERLEKRARDLGAELGIVVTTQRDPRGASVKLWADREDGRALGVFS